MWNTLCSSDFTVKKRKNWHRHDYTEPDDGSKPVQAGTLVFVRQLEARTFARYVNEDVSTRQRHTEHRVTRANWKYSNHLFEDETAVSLTTATNTKALLGIINLTNQTE